MHMKHSKEEFVNTQSSTLLFLKEMSGSKTENMTVTSPQ